MTDPIADMLTRIRNAIMANKDTVEVPSSKMKVQIADILLDEGYVSAVAFDGEGISKKIIITLKYVNKRESVINGLKRVSRPGLRIYTDVENMPKVREGLGTAILSTNKGVMTDKAARANNVGGEVLLYVW
ncbi:MAG: 30S ribosomal protein S8 [Clostridia bacterium]|nr:30S ribosomal protein S8 [Clostridia bacterium]